MQQQCKEGSMQDFGTDAHFSLVSRDFYCSRQNTGRAPASLKSTQIPTATFLPKSQKHAGDLQGSSNGPGCSAVFCPMHQGQRLLFGRNHCLPVFFFSQFLSLECFFLRRLVRHMPAAFGGCLIDFGVVCVQIFQLGNQLFAAVPVSSLRVSEL
jgi:hypothetical protein